MSCHCCAASGAERAGFRIWATWQRSQLFSWSAQSCRLVSSGGNRGDEGSGVHKRRNEENEDERRFADSRKGANGVQQTTRFAVAGFRRPYGRRSAQRAAAKRITSFVSVFFVAPFVNSAASITFVVSATVFSFHSIDDGSNVAS